METDTPQKRRYTIGVMETTVEEQDNEDFRAIVDRAVKAFQENLQDIDVEVQLFQFRGPHLSPVEGAYSPFDYMHIGIHEKLERRLAFLMMITEVDLGAEGISYVLAFPSRLTNIGIMSTKRLSPEFWGHAADHEVWADRLSAILMHTFGHLVNLEHDEDPANMMYDFALVDDLDQMNAIREDQIQQMQKNLPKDAHDEVTERNAGRFAARQVWRNLGEIFRMMLRANPLRLLTRLPTMVTAGFSVIIALFFQVETWDLGGTVDLYQLIIFAIISIIAASVLLYQSFGFRAVSSRRRAIAESTVVTIAVTMLSLIVTMILLYAIFFAAIYIAIITIFPPSLMTTWVTVDPAVNLIDHLRLSFFLAGMGILAGSLGGRADSANVVRGVLFIDEET